MTNLPSARAAIERLIDADDAFVALEGPIDAGRPWPQGPVSGEGPESEWGPLEVLAHVAEMLGYWLDQMELVIAGTGEPVPMGRSPGDPNRNLAIETGRGLSTAELLSRIRAAIGRYVARLPEWTPDDWAKRGLHPVRGEMAIADMLDRLVLGHVDEHVAQVGATLEARSRTGDARGS